MHVMDTEKATTSTSSEKTDQIEAGHEPVTLAAPDVLYGAESEEEIVYLHGIRFAMLATLFVPIDVSVSIFLDRCRD